MAKNYMAELERLKKRYEQFKSNAEELKVELKSEETTLNKLKSTVSDKYGREYHTLEELEGAIRDKERRIEDMLDKVEDKLNGI